MHIPGKIFETFLVKGEKVVPYFCFFLVFIYDIFHIYIANIIFFCFLILYLLKHQKVLIIKNRVAQLFCILFISWATISTAFYIIEMQEITARTIIQYLFTLQYIILLVSINIKKDQFELWIYRFAVLNALFIITLYFYYNGFLPFGDELWGYKCIPGWPNSTPIPLLMGLWLSYKNKNSITGKILIYLTLFLTTSRAAILGGLIITCYFLLSRIKYNKRCIGFLFLLIIFALIGVRYWMAIDPLFIKSMTRTWDRIDIFNTTLSYLELRPILGYGGNTIDQLTNIDINYIPAMNWPHTHNLILEMLLRYGIIGALLFLGYIGAILARIKNKDRRFMFLLLLFLSLFQIYIRDFVFLFFLLYLSIENNNGHAPKMGFSHIATGE